MIIYNLELEVTYRPGLIEHAVSGGYDVLGGCKNLQMFPLSKDDLASQKNKS